MDKDDIMNAGKLEVKYFNDLLYRAVTSKNASIILIRTHSSDQCVNSSLFRKSRARTFCENFIKSRFIRPGLNVLHAPNQILILVDSNEYVRLICRIKLLSASDVF